MSQESMGPVGAIVAEQSAPAEQTEQQTEQQAPPEVKPQEDKFASKFAALSRKEKAIRAQEQHLQQYMKQLQEKEEKYKQWEESQKDPKNDWKNQFKENPFKMLEEAGLSFEQLVEMQLNEQKPTPEMLIKRTKAELESKYTKELEELRNSMLEKERKEEEAKYNQTVSAFKSQINSYLESNTDTYELTLANQAQDLVFEVVEEHYKETGRILDIEEAAKAVESHFEEEAKKLLELKKLKQVSQKPEAKPQQKESATLSNTMSSEVPVKGERKLSKEESLAQAAKLIRWGD